MTTSLDLKNSLELTREGARVRVLGRRKDACPYPLDSPERIAWMEGFEGEPLDRDPDAATGQD